MRKLPTLLSFLLLASLAVAENDPGIGERLERMYVADQDERRSGRMSKEADAARLAQVKAWLQEDRLETGADYYHAAMILQHSTDRSGRDHLTAHVLATAAAIAGDERGKWLAAAALDRFLDFNDRPQFFGTQFQRDGEGVWHPGGFDSYRTPNLRRLFGVADATTMQRQAEGFNRPK